MPTVRRYFCRRHTSPSRCSCCLPDGPNGVKINANPGNERSRWMAGRPIRCLLIPVCPQTVSTTEIFLLPSLPMNPPPARRCAAPLATSQRPAAGRCGSHVCLRWRSLRIRHVPSRGPRNPHRFSACLLTATLLRCLPNASVCRLRLGVLRSTVHVGSYRPFRLRQSENPSIHLFRWTLAPKLSPLLFPSAP